MVIITVQIYTFSFFPCNNIYSFLLLIRLFVLDIRNPIELDLYALETSSRKMINDLVSPVISKMNEDREVILQTRHRFNIFEERLTNLEYLL